MKEDNCCHLCEDFEDGFSTLLTKITLVEGNLKTTRNKYAAKQKELKDVKKQLNKAVKGITSSKVATITQKPINLPTTAKALKQTIKEAGCCRCDYKVPCGIDFHHVSTKSGAIASMSVDQLLTEIDCHPVVLLCANCHREVHAGIRDNEFSDTYVLKAGDYVQTNHPHTMFHKSPNFQDTYG